jgi:hypothetical protein
VKTIQIWIISVCLATLFVLGVPLSVNGAAPVVLDEASETYANTPKNIKLNNMSRVEVFSIVGKPSNGTISAINSTNGVVTYTPNAGFIGDDIFKYNATTGSQTSQPASVTLSVIPEPIILKDSPELRAGLAFGLSLVIVFLIFLAIFLIVRTIRMRKNEKRKLKFWDIIRDDNWYPSLAIFQFLLWTGIVLFAYTGTSITRLFSGFGVLMDIPANLILVMGISGAVTVVNGVVSDFKYAGTTPPKVEPTKQVPSDEIRKKLPGFKTMLMENGKITLPRFQMFAWTWIGIITYLGILFWQVDVKLGSLEGLFLPELPFVFVSLMGISQVTYITAKSVKPAFFSINEVRPRRIRLQKENNLITILGSNFGNKGTVWIEYYRPLSVQEKEQLGCEEDCDDEYLYNNTRLEEQFMATPKEPREDSRIVVSLDSIKDKLKAQTYVVRVEKEGLLTYATSDAKLEIINDPTKEIINNPPKAADVSVEAESNKPKSIQLTATDPDAGDHLTYSKVSDPSHGTLSNVDPNTGIVTYTPKDYAGDDSFTFKASDGKVDSNTAKVNISIKKVAKK